MTHQEMFDKAWEHFVVNKAPASISTFGFNLYRGENNNRCAIGLFIPDSLYSSEMENTAVAFLVRKFPKLDEFIVPRSGLESDIGFSIRLQRCHDHLTNASDDFAIKMKERLVALANEYNLQIPATI